ncbi:MAG: DUF3472 domain-containing protein [Verrucomicrobia bacterium]|nr:DUF3472 domain-containing protein [Verrucomicrobiota bacterium]MBT6236959.1 DUF3472 domain-containing protein [Verrucomicrobiota bacterium]
MCRLTSLHQPYWGRMPLLLLAALLFVVSHPVQGASLEIPAETAYLEPDHGDARVSRRGGIVDWASSSTSIQWFGKAREAGTVDVSLRIKGNDDGEAILLFQIGQKTMQKEIKIKQGEETMVSFDSFPIPSPGYHAFKLSRVNQQQSNPPSIDVLKLELSGDLAHQIHFNLKSRRNAASVHLAYPVQSDREVAAFYCEMTALEDPVHSYYMACGWHRGYFGMQVNSSSERRIIFSVWDRGNEPTDPSKVENEDRVKLIKKGDGVFTGRFGNEGTGGHSHLKYPWKTDSLQKFLVTAKPKDETHTVFSGYYFHPDSQQWMLISSWSTPGEGGYMRGLYSFSENFVGRNGHLLRKALYGNQWILDSKGTWHEQTTAKFSHDPTGREDRLDRYMGLEQGQFFLSHGGFLDGFTAYGTLFQRPASGTRPKELMNLSLDQ